MFDQILETLGSFAPTWATWMGVSILDAAIVLVLAAAVWFIIRKKASAQFGYCLFLLVLLKLLVPLQVVVPESLARWTPAHMVSAATTMLSTTETALPEIKLPETKLPRDRREPLESPLTKTFIEAAVSEADAAPIALPLKSPLAASQSPPTAKPQAAWGYPAVFAGLMLAWAGGSCFLFVRFLLVQVRFHRRLKEAAPLDLAGLGVDFAELCARIDIRRPVRVVETASMASPAVWGIRRPVVIMPRGMAASLSPKQLQWILLHELAHIRRHDLAVTCVQRLITIVHFLNPAVWLANRTINRLREYACDDMALTLTAGSPIESSEAFMHVVTHAAKNRPRLTANMDAALGVFDSGSRATCFQRMSRLLDTNRRPKVRLGLFSICTLLLAAILTLPQIRAGDDSAEVEKPTVEKTTGTAQAKKPKKTEKAAKASGHSLLLTVLDGKGKPVPGARVKKRVRLVSGGPFKFTQDRCDENGRLRIDMPNKTPSFFRITVDSSGCAPFYAGWNQRDGPDPIPDSFTMRLDPGRLIGGIVQDEDGKPITGVKVKPRFNMKMREERARQLGAGVTIKTDAQGRWTYPSFPANLQQVELFLQHPEHIGGRDKGPVSKFAISKGEVPKVVSVMKRGLIITGKVTDENGRPVADAVVHYHHRISGSSGVSKATTDKNGSYRFTNGKAGDAILTASAEEWAPSLVETQVEPGMKAVDFKLTRGQQLSVRVVDPENKPIVGVGVSPWTWQGKEILHNIQPARGKTDANGVWTWNHAPQGQIGVHIHKQGYAYIRDQELVPGEQENVVTMRPKKVQLLRVSGRVIDARTKKPINRFRSIIGGIHKESGPTYWHQDSRSEGRGGNYRRDISSSRFGTHNSSFVIRIEADGYTPATSRSFKLDEGNVTFDFELEKASGLGVVVITPQGKIAKNATVAVCTPRLGPIIEDGAVLTNSTCQRTTTDTEGRFNLAPQSGVFALMVVHESGMSYVSQEKFKSSKTIQLEPWARVEGTLLIGGKPAAGEKVCLDRANIHDRNAPKFHLSYRTTTDKDGNFAFDNVVLGEGRVYRSAVSYHGQSSSWIPTHSTKARFIAGKTTQVKLARNGRPVVGRLIVAKPGTKKIDWSYATVSMRKFQPPAPMIPLPDGIDPRQDREAAMNWWNTWKETAEGKRYRQEIDQYNKANRERRADSYSTKVESDGSFKFDDIPAEDYTLTARLPAPPAKGRIESGKVIATLSYKFIIPKMPGGRSGEPLDLGMLLLKSVSTPDPRGGNNKKPAAK